MAQRSSTALETIPANEILSILVEMTKDTPKISLRALELESATPVADLLPILDELENAGKIDSEGRGDDTLIWVKTSAPAKKPRRTKAQMDAAKAEASARNAKAAKSPEYDRNGHAEGTLGFGASDIELDEMHANGVDADQPFHTPEAAEDFATMGKGEPAAGDTQTGLTREQIAHEIKSTPLEIQEGEPVKLVTLPKPFSPEFHESALVKNGLALDEPEFIPEKPEGVNANTWYMAHAAITQTARDWWMDRANEQCAEYMLALTMSADVSA